MSAPETAGEIIRRRIGRDLMGISSRESYEAGGWHDGRLGQAYDLIFAVLKDRGEKPFRHALLSQIESMDDEQAI